MRGRRSADRHRASVQQRHGREPDRLLVHRHVQRDRQHPSGVIHASGAEHFVGCLDAGGAGACGTSDPSGSLALTFKFEGKFDAASNEIRGRCQHKIVSGTGGFAGATGRIDITDNITNETSNYRGHITLADVPMGPAARAARAAAANHPRSIC